MDCLTCIAAVYISGSLGVQNVDSIEANRSNDYGFMVGMVELVVELENNLFIKASHYSGVNTAEADWGKNSVEIGGKIFLWRRN